MSFKVENVTNPEKAENLGISEGCNPFQHLPEEVIVNLFSRLDLQSQARTAQVDRQFNRIIASEELIGPNARKHLVNELEKEGIFAKDLFKFYIGFCCRQGDRGVEELNTNFDDLKKCLLNDKKISNSGLYKLLVDLRKFPENSFPEKSKLIPKESWDIVRFHYINTIMKNNQNVESSVTKNAGFFEDDCLKIALAVGVLFGAYFLNNYGII